MQPSLIERFSDFLEASPTPFHVTQNIKLRLDASGFMELDESKLWDLKPEGRYYVIRNSASIIAFTGGGEEIIEKGIHMVGAHTDSPALKIKPLPDIKKAGVNQLGVEVYGGALLNPWFDRDLGIAGRVSYEESKGALQHVLIDFKEPVACIPSLAIHLDRDANSNRTINPQKDLPVIIGLEKEQTFHDLLKKEIGEDKVASVYSFDLFLYDTQAPSRLGTDKELFASARLDNLLSCFCALEAMLESDHNAPALFVFNDHEEIGSGSAHGAESNFLELLLHRIAQGHDSFARMMQGSVFLSTDNAHALHPNYSDIHDPNHAPLIGQGVAIKYNANQAYATDSQSSALFQMYAKRANAKVQSYVVRSDMRCGSTIGPITATKLGVSTVDIGVPTWGMHSIRETAAVKDIEDMQKILTAFYNRN